MSSVVVCGFCRAGTTLIYNLLRATVTNFRTYPHESTAKEPAGWITKRPLDIFRDLPGFERIVMVRDPRSVITSEHWNHRGHYFVSADACREGTPGLLEQHRAMRELDGERVFYEELTQDPDSLQSRLGERFGFEYEGVFSDHPHGSIPSSLSKALNGVRPIDSGHDWRDHPERIADQFTRFPELFDVLVELGYERDRDWFCT